MKGTFPCPLSNAHTLTSQKARLISSLDSRNGSLFRYYKLYLFIQGSLIPRDRCQPASITWRPMWRPEPDKFFGPKGHHRVIGPSHGLARRARNTPWARARTCWCVWQPKWRLIDPHRSMGAAATCRQLRRRHNASLVIRSWSICVLIPHVFNSTISTLIP